MNSTMRSLRRPSAKREFARTTNALPARSRTRSIWDRAASQWHRRSWDLRPGNRSKVATLSIVGRFRRRHSAPKLGPRPSPNLTSLRNSGLDSRPSLPSLTAQRVRVRQFRGQGLGIQAAGVACFAGLWWWLGLRGAFAGAALMVLALLVGRTKSKPWRCGNCSQPLATAKVRVCPRCHAYFLDEEPPHVMPVARNGG